jgi:flagellar assembly factor FliW
MVSTGTLCFDSQYFGPLEFDAGAAFDFSEGLPGFESERFFAPIEIPGQHPLLYLQSVNRPDLCLITLPVRTVCADYQLEVLPEYLDVLGISRESDPRIGSDLLCLTIILVDEERKVTANLLAPIVVDMRTRKAVQAIQSESGYGCRHPLEIPGEEGMRC